MKGHSKGEREIFSFLCKTVKASDEGLAKKKGQKELGYLGKKTKDKNVGSSQSGN